MSCLILYDGANLLGDVFDENWCLIILTTYIQCMYKQHIETLLDHLTTLIRAWRKNGHYLSIQFGNGVFYYVFIERTAFL